MNDQEHVCRICGFPAIDNYNLEKHHLFGRVNSPITEYLCKNCHHIITTEQNSLPPWARSPSENKIILWAYASVSLGALLKRIGEEMIRIGKLTIEWIKENDSSLCKGIPKKERG